MRVLVVDDEPAIARLFTQRLRKEIRDGKISFEFAQSAGEAVELLEKSDADFVMILSDINMPGMTGIELLEQIRLKNRQLPVYMISAYENEQYSRVSLEKGANGFIPKPLDFSVIRKLLELGDES